MIITLRTHMKKFIILATIAFLANIPAYSMQSVLPQKTFKEKCMGQLANLTNTQSFKWVHSHKKELLWGAAAIGGAIALGKYLFKTMNAQTTKDKIKQETDASIYSHLLHLRDGNVGIFYCKKSSNHGGYEINISPIQILGLCVGAQVTYTYLFDNTHEIGITMFNHS